MAGGRGTRFPVTSQTISQGRPWQAMALSLTCKSQSPVYSLTSQCPDYIPAQKYNNRIWGWDPGIADFYSSPDDFNVQSRLRTTDRRCVGDPDEGWGVVKEKILSTCFCQTFYCWLLLVIQYKINHIQLWCDEQVRILRGWLWSRHNFKSQNIVLRGTE